MIGAFKSITTHRYIEGVKLQGWAVFNGRLWQRDFYDHIIRTEEEHSRIRAYILNNPAQWDEDIDNPKNIKNRS